VLLNLNAAAVAAAFTLFLTVVPTEPASIIIATISKVIDDTLNNLLGIFPSLDRQRCQRCMRALQSCLESPLPF
jgi:hypothetical protein